MLVIQKELGASLKIDKTTITITDITHNYTDLLINGTKKIRKFYNESLTVESASILICWSSDKNVKFVMGMPIEFTYRQSELMCA